MSPSGLVINASYLRRSSSSRKCHTTLTSGQMSCRARRAGSLGTFSSPTAKNGMPTCCRLPFISNSWTISKGRQLQRIIDTLDAGALAAHFDVSLVLGTLDFHELLDRSGHRQSTFGAVRPRRSIKVVEHDTLRSLMNTSKVA